MTKHSAFVLRAVLVGSAIFLLGACGLLAPKPAQLVAALDTTSSLNPDSKGRASPVVVRLFELKTAAAFNSADFFSLWERESQSLGADLVAREEFQLRPGEHRDFERVLQPETTHIAVVAAFRDLEHAQWRSTFAVAAHQKQAIAIRLDSRAVSITGK